MDGPSVEDFEGYRGRPAGSLTAWFRSVPCDTPTRIPEEFLDRYGPEGVRGFVSSAYRQKGIGSVRKWPDGTVWVLRRSVPKPRGQG